MRTTNLPMDEGSENGSTERRENPRRFSLKHGGVGDSPKTSSWWLKLAGLLALIAFVGQTVGYPGISVAVTASSGVGVMLIQDLAWILVVLSFATLFVGLLAATVQAYLNGNLGVSLVLAVAPEAGFVVASPIADRFLFVVNPGAWAISEGGPLLWIVIGVTALLIGFAGFLLGTGARAVSGRFVTRTN